MGRKKFPFKQFRPKPVPIILVLFLLIAAVIAVDYVRWKRGKAAPRPVKSRDVAESSAPSVPLSQIVQSFILSQGVLPSSIHRFEDDHQVLHLRVNLPLRDYRRLELVLPEKIKEAHATVLRKDVQPGRQKNFFLWHIRGSVMENLMLLFACQEEKPEKIVAIVIDDMGYSLEALESLSNLKVPVTVSIIPFSPHARETARLAQENGLEVMLHLPLESWNNSSHLRMPGMIYSEMTPDDIRNTVLSCVEQVPLAKGVNNHEGSRITADESSMKIILGTLKEKNLYFIDSRTSAKSIAFELARQMGIPSAERRVFLDAENSVASLKKRLNQLFRIAEKEGKAVGIGHPSAETLRALQECSALAQKHNLKIVPASQIVNLP
jgi:polysaccharide deacetylase 2 family uncharacterized protein YibQ